MNFDGQIALPEASIPGGEITMCFGCCKTKGTGGVLTYEVSSALNETKYLAVMWRVPLIRVNCENKFSIAFGDKSAC